MLGGWVWLSVQTEYLRSNGCRGSIMTALTTEGIVNGCTVVSALRFPPLSSVGENRSLVILLDCGIECV